MNTMKLYTQLQTALYRLRASATNEQGMEVVEKVGMISIMLALLTAIGAAFERGGMEVGQVALDAMISFIRQLF
jgi:hypothetical protein